MTEFRGFIYRIRNEANRKVYIGSTVCHRTRRTNHFSALRSGSHVNRHLQSAFNKHGEDCFAFEVIMEVSQGSEAMLSFESLAIRLYDSKNPLSGYNILDPREVSDHPHSKPVVQCSLSGEFIAEYKSISEAERSVGISHGTIGAALGSKPDVVSCAGFLWLHRDEFPQAVARKVERYRQSKQAVPVLQYSLDGKLVAEHDSCMDAARNTPASCPGIYANVVGTTRSSSGFLWVHKGTPQVEIDRRLKEARNAKHPSAKTVIQSTKNGETVRAFPSVAEASRCTGINANGIRNAAGKFKVKTAGGYRWEYAT